MEQLPSDLLERYYLYLKKLVGMPTCFWDEARIHDAMAYCREVMDLLPDHWASDIDEVGNLIVYNQLANPNQPMLYLSSHVDVVGATNTDWKTPPFSAVETEAYISGRGVNDCKAGTALQLVMAWHLAGADSRRYNLGFMFMFREEGNAGKTSSAIDFRKLPVCPGQTYFLTLENTVEKNGEEAILGYYDREPHNLFIALSGYVPEFNRQLPFLTNLGWKPVTLNPIGFLPAGEPDFVFNNPDAGHSATASNENSFLALVMERFGEQAAIVAGQRRESSVIASQVNIYSDKPVLHELVLNYRGFEDIATIRQNLSHFEYIEAYPFDQGLGSDQSDAVLGSQLPELLSHMADRHLPVKRQPNPGRSDASSIWNALPMELKGKVIPVAIGPGCRSHTDHTGLRRATHGANEGFYKPFAPRLITAFLELLNHFKIKDHDNTRIFKRQLSTAL